MKIGQSVTRNEKGMVETLVIRHPLAEAEIALFGGQLLSYRPCGAEEVIWLSEAAKLDGSAPIRGGVPICWPWFGKGQQPSHGFARTTLWQLDSCDENDAGVVIELVARDTASTRKIWPHHFHNRIRFEIGRRLNITLIVTNTDKSPWHFTGALHSYFQVGDIEKVGVDGLGAKYHDSVTGQDIVGAESPLVISAEVDRIYTQAGQRVNLRDDDMGRTIQIESAGHTDTVVWNPWADLSKGMADMTDEGYRTMLCVESAVVAEPVTLEPGQQHHLKARFSVGNPCF